MNIQILGAAKSADTRKAIRFFKERGVPNYFRDLTEKGFSRGELENIGRSVPPEELIDPTGQAYKKRGLQYMDFDPIEELQEYPLLAKLPVVRNGREATVGFSPETWKSWIKKDRAGG